MKTESISGIPIGKCAELENLSISELARLVRQLLKRVKTLGKENAPLRAQLGVAKRSEAPFSKNLSPAPPKKPRCHQGKGWLEKRNEPVRSSADRLEELSMLMDSPDCLRCGARLEVAERMVMVEPPSAESVRIIRRLCAEFGSCGVCGWNVRGRHADLATGECKATTHRTSLQVMTRALTLHYHDGLPLGRVSVVFRMRYRQRHQKVVKMIRACFAGLQRTDRGVCHEADAMDTIEQQKCLRNLLKNLIAAEGTRIGQTKAFLWEPKATLRGAIQLWRKHGARERAPDRYRERRQVIRQKVDRQLRDRRLIDPDNQWLLKGIGLQHDNGRVLLFLKRLEISPANNCAERRLCGAIIARKVSNRSKAERGARTYKAMKSITATLTLRGHQVASTLAGIISDHPMPQTAAP